MNTDEGVMRQSGTRYETWAEIRDWLRNSFPFNDPTRSYERHQAELDGWAAYVKQLQDAANILAETETDTLSEATARDGGVIQSNLYHEGVRRDAMHAVGGMVAKMEAEMGIEPDNGAIGGGDVGEDNYWNRERCGTCRFYGGSETGWMWRDCRRHAPIGRDMGDGTGRGTFPQTQPNDICGDYEANRSPPDSESVPSVDEEMPTLGSLWGAAPDLKTRQMQERELVEKVAKWLAFEYHESLRESAEGRAKDSWTAYCDSARRLLTDTGIIGGGE